MMTDETYEAIKKSDTALGGNLMNVHNYDILANPIYQKRFQYVPCNVPNREMFIIDNDDDDTNNDMQSNKTRIMLNLGYFY